MLFPIDPTLLTENGKTAVFVPSTTGGSGGYWNVGTGARQLWTTRATAARVRVFCNQVNDPRTTNLNLLCYRVNGQDYWANAVAPFTLTGSGTYAWYDLILPGGYTSKTVELFVPVIGVVVLNQPAKGAWPIEIEFNADAVSVAPVTTGAHRVIYGDSITTNMNAMVPSLQGFVGIMKRGTSDPLYPATSIASVPRWKGVYSAGTLYAVNDLVSYSGSTWRKLTTAAAGTTPVSSTDWEMRGYLGRVTQVAYGFRRLFDDAGSGGVYDATKAAAFAASLASVATGTPELLMMIGSNDWFNGWSNVAAFQTAYTGVLNQLFSTSLATVPIRCVSPIITTAREGANGAGNTMDDYRAAISASVTAAMTAHPTMNITYVDGKAILATTDLDDGLHPNSAGHAKLRVALA
jgi:lysophospholipase L1-like esterase